MNNKKLQEINQEIKVYFVDLDGTLLNSKENGKKIPSDTNVLAISNAKKQGKSIVVSTGRNFKEAILHGQYIDSPYVISSNGAQIHDGKGKLLREFYLSKEEVEKAIEFAKKHKLLLGLSQDKMVFGAKSFIRRKIIKSFGWKSEKKYSLNLNKKIYKLFFLGKKSKLIKLKTQIKNLIPDATLVFQGPILELTHKEATKGLAAEFVWKRMKLVKKQTAHIGDTGNDASTQKHVEALIAVGNADKELMKVADYVGPNYKKDGVARILLGEYYKVKG